MFDSAFRTVFLSTPAKLRHANKRLLITQSNIDKSCLDSKNTQQSLAHLSHNQSDKVYVSDKSEVIAIPLSDILCIILESPQITLSSSLFCAFAKAKILVFVCDEAHLPCGIFSPFLAHYKSLKLLQTQIALKKQQKALLWQQIIKSKIANQAALLKARHCRESEALEQLAKNVCLGDASNNEAKASAMYFKALFGKHFSRKDSTNDKNAIINAGLNYGYAIVRGIVVRGICASGLNPALGLFHANVFNPFNLADDVMEPYRIFVDALVCEMLDCGQFDVAQGLNLEVRAKLVSLLSSKITIDSKDYPLYRASIQSIQSLIQAMDSHHNILSLPSFIKEYSNGREIYESAGAI